LLQNSALLLQEATKLAELPREEGQRSKAKSLEAVGDAAGEALLVCVVVLKTCADWWALLCFGLSVSLLCAL
jgi:hypothetical protein